MINTKIMLLFLLPIALLSGSAYGTEEKVISADLVSPAGFDLPTITDKNLTVSVFTSGLEFPTAIDFVGDDVLVLEKNGDVHLIKNNFLVKEPILEIDVDEWRENGLFGILVKDCLLYTSPSPRD